MSYFPSGNVPLCPPGSPQCSASVLTTHQSASLSRLGWAGAGAGAGAREIKARLQSTRRFISLNNPAPTLESCMQLLALHRGNNTMAPGDCGSHPSIFFLHPLLWVTAARLPGPTRRWDGPGGALCSVPAADSCKVLSALRSNDTNSN